MFGNPLISLGPAVNGLQHETDQKNGDETARNPYFSGLTAGDPSRIRTCNPRSRNPLLFQASTPRGECVAKYGLFRSTGPMVLVAREQELRNLVCTAGNTPKLSKGLYRFGLRVSH
jgi:hypothetical protein